MENAKPIVISLGGSLIVPQTGIDTVFLSEFNTFIRKKITENHRFFLVAGGGATAREYIQGAKSVVGSVRDIDLDWLGIHTTRLNAHLIRTIFHDVAHPRVITNYEKKIANPKQPVVVAAGWKPGCSTDYDAVLIARDYEAPIVINMSNITAVYDRDPNQYPDAHPIEKISWKDFAGLIDGDWKPGMNVPFDLLATKLAMEMGLTVYIVGKDLSNLDHILSGTSFVGTVISPERTSRYVPDA